MKYLRKFNSEEEYEFSIDSMVNYPNVCLIAENRQVVYNYLFQPQTFPLYIEAIQNLTVEFSNTYEYSKDNKTWTSVTSPTSIQVSAGEVVFFRASGLTASSSDGIGWFTISNGDCNVGGNIMSMAYGADFEGKTEILQEHQFTALFAENNNIIDASNLVLPATTLTYRCYSYMFYNCRSLVNAPKLPATTLSESCYIAMFRNCTSLVNAPELPATTLKGGCYNSMFQNCTSLINAPELLATKLVDSCYGNMFTSCTNLNYIKAMFTTSPNSNYTNAWVVGVSASGTFVKNSSATWELVGANGSPTGWTIEYAEA